MTQRKRGQGLVNRRSGFALLAVGSQVAAAQGSISLPLYSNLGSVTFLPEGLDPHSQGAHYFAQGFRLFLLFDRPRALLSFQRARQLGCSLPLCAWGEALALGPTLNTFEDPLFFKRLPLAFNAARHAVQLLGAGGLPNASAAAASAKSRDTSLVIAMGHRYAFSRVAYQKDRNKYDSQYAARMALLVGRFPLDDHVAVLAAIALMQPLGLSLDDSMTGALKQPALQALALTEVVLRRSPNNVGAIVLHALLTMQSPSSGQHWHRAKLLPHLAPGAAHGSHIAALAALRDRNVGDAERYSRAAAAATDQPYPQHYLEMLVHIQVMRGESRAALATANNLLSMAKRSLQSDRWEMGSTSERYAVQLLLVQDVFAEWGSILATTQPPDTQLYRVAVWHYAQGRALVAKGSRQSAQEHRDRLQQIHVRLIGRLRKDTTVYGRLPVLELTSILAHLLDAALHHGVADIVPLRRAVTTYASLAPDGPPALRQQPRVVLGVALLRHGDAAGARAQFSKELADWPCSGWALFGLNQACMSLADDDCVQSSASKFYKAWSAADIELQSATAIKTRPSFLKKCMEVLPRIMLTLCLIMALVVCLLAMCKRRKTRVPQDYRPVSGKDATDEDAGSGGSL